MPIEAKAMKPQEEKTKPWARLVTAPRGQARGPGGPEKVTASWQEVWRRAAGGKAGEACSSGTVA